MLFIFWEQHINTAPSNQLTANGEGVGPYVCIEGKPNIKGE